MAQQHVNENHAKTAEYCPVNASAGQPRQVNNPDPRPETRAAIENWLNYNIGNKAC